MNIRLVDGWWRHGVGVVLTAALLFGVAANAAPRGGDEAVRGMGKSGAEVTRLVTGDPAQISDSITGTPPTAILAITPVQPPAAATPVNSYPAGCTIVGQELRCDRNDNAGFRAWFNLQLSGWDPAGNGPNAERYQFKVECSGYWDSDCLGDQPDLLPAGWTNVGRGIPCSDATVCRVTFGESFAKCTRGFCDAGYIDADGTGRSDSFCAAPEACSFPGVAMGTCNFTYFAGSGSTLGTADGGFVYHGGTLVLDIPPGAKGKYTVPLKDDTFIATPWPPPTDIPTARESGFVVNLVTGSCCFGLGTPDAGCVDTCITRADCNALPGPSVFTPDGHCPPHGPDCSDFLGACCDLDPSGPCTDDTVLTDCLCATCAWHKLQACSDINCDPTPIPTVSEWGLAIMTLLLLTGAKVLFARSPVARE